MKETADGDTEEGDRRLFTPDGALYNPLKVRFMIDPATEEGVATVPIDALRNNFGRRMTQGEKAANGMLSKALCRAVMWNEVDLTEDQRAEFTGCFVVERGDLDWPVPIGIRAARADDLVTMLPDLHLPRFGKKLQTRLKSLLGELVIRPPED